MGLFDKFKRANLAELEEFVVTHQGVEGYLEPLTPTMPLSLLIVARNGEWARATVADRGQAGSFCKKLGIPIYDAAVVGYPERMRGFKGHPAPDAPTAEELAAWYSQPSSEEADDAGE